MTDLDLLKDRLSEAAILADGLLKDPSGDHRVDLRMLRFSISGTLDAAVRLARSVEAERQRGQLAGLRNLELMDPDNGSGLA